MLYVLMKEQHQYMRDLALAQIALDKEKGVEKFEAYRKEMFPWVEIAKKRDEAMHKQILNDMVKGGPLAVFAPKPQGVKSRLVKRVERVQEPVSKEEKARKDALYKRLGKMIPT